MLSAKAGPGPLGFPDFILWGKHEVHLLRGKLDLRGRTEATRTWPGPLTSPPLALPMVTPVTDDLLSQPEPGLGFNLSCGHWPSLPPSATSPIWPRPQDDSRPWKQQERAQRRIQSRWGAVGVSLWES